MRPSEWVDGVLVRSLSPLRVAGELVRPLRWFRHGEIQAAEGLIARSAAAEAVDGPALLEELAQRARPTEAALRRGRRIVHAEVVGRDPSSRDRLIVHLPDGRGVDVGMPVAFGNAYLGRVVSLDPKGAGNSMGAQVELVTARGFFVGGRLDQPGPWDGALMTVGGIDPENRAGRSSIRLAVHNPSDRSVETGLVRVHELFPDVDPYPRLAEGYRLGTVKRGRDRLWAIDPEVDFLDGLFHVVVIAPLDPHLGSTEPSPHVLRDNHWTLARPLSSGDPNPRRRTGLVSVGEAHGVGQGAAVTFGARLLGRVGRVSRWSAEVRFLADPGVSVVAVASFSGVDGPRILGRLVSLGQDPRDHSTLFRWRLAVPLGIPAGEGGLPRRATIVTGSGDPGLPAGLVLGQALIPLGGPEPAEGRIVRLLPDAHGDDVDELWVRTMADESSVQEGAE